MGIHSLVENSSLLIPIAWFILATELQGHTNAKRTYIDVTGVNNTM